jgi:hypothetical protein
MSEWFMLGADERQYGPVSREALQKWFEEGRIDANCQIYRRGWAEWKWADDEFPELAAESTPPTPSESQSPPPPAVSPSASPAGATTALVASSNAAPAETNSLESLDTLPVWGDIRRDLRRRVSYARIAAIAGVFLTVAAIAGGGYLVAQNWSGSLNRSVLIGTALCISGLLGGLPVIWAMLSQAASLSKLTRNATTAQWRTSARGDARLWRMMALAAWLVFLLAIAVAALVLAMARGLLPS